MEGGSLTNELMKRFGCQADLVSASAFVQQRGKILPEAFETIFRLFTETFEAGPLYKGYRLLAVDGSDIQIPTNPQDPESYFPGANGQKPYNLLHLNAMYDLLQRTYVDAIVQKRHVYDECRTLVDMVDRSSRKQPGDRIKFCVIDRKRQYENLRESQEWKQTFRTKEPKKMKAAPQDLLKEYVKSQQFTSTADIMQAMKEMFRDVIQQVMEVEMDEELGRERCQRSEETEHSRNYRNGYSQKTVKTQLGEIEIKVPRDRKGSYEPKIISKYDRNAEGMEDKILSLYACGMSQKDIAEQIKSLYDVEISPELVSKISEKIMPEVTAWQNRPLESVYPFIFMDAIHYKVKEDHRYVTKAAYVVLGITMEGKKDILGVWIGEHESSKFWLSVLNDLKSRGVLDVYLFCTDGLCGMMQAIEAVYPKSRLQRCIVHQIRSSTRYVSYKDIKQVVADLKKIYTAVTLEEAENNLVLFADRWRKQYPSCVKSWEENWDVLNTFFEYPPEIRKIIYTTNIIEGLNRQFRQITKNKPSFTNDDSLRKMLYLASQRIVRHWHARYQNWDLVLSQLEIMFADRTPG